MCPPQPRSLPAVDATVVITVQPGGAVQCGRSGRGGALHAPRPRCRSGPDPNARPPDPGKWPSRLTCSLHPSQPFSIPPAAARRPRGTAPRAGFGARQCPQHRGRAGRPSSTAGPLSSTCRRAVPSRLGLPVGPWAFYRKVHVLLASSFAAPAPPRLAFKDGLRSRPPAHSAARPALRAASQRRRHLPARGHPPTGAPEPAPPQLQCLPLRLTRETPMHDASVPVMKNPTPGRPAAAARKNSGSRRADGDGPGRAPTTASRPPQITQLGVFSVIQVVPGPPGRPRQP